MKICYWKFEGNLNTHVPLWAQQHMVDRHYSLNLKQWSARTLYVYAHGYLAQKYSVGLQKIFDSRLCSQEENSFFLPWSYSTSQDKRESLLSFLVRREQELHESWLENHGLNEQKFSPKFGRAKPQSRSECKRLDENCRSNASESWDSHHRFTRAWKPNGHAQHLTCERAYSGHETVVDASWWMICLYRTDLHKFLWSQWEFRMRNFHEKIWRISIRKVWGTDIVSDTYHLE